MHAVERERRWSFLALATIFVVIGNIVGILRADLVVAGTTWAMTLGAAAALLAARATPSGAEWAKITEFIALLAFAASTLAFFLVFPINRMHAPWARRILGSALGISLGVAAGYLGIMVIDAGGYAILQTVFFLVLALELGGAAFLAAWSVFRATPAQRAAKRALGLVAFGATAGLLPFCLLVLIPDALGDRAIVRPDLAVFSLVLLPASLGAAVVSHQFPGITRLMRRASVALVIWVTIIGIVSAGFVWVARWEAEQSRAQIVDLNTAAVLVTVVAGGFWPLQRELRRALERRIFHDVYDYRAVLHELSAETVRLTDLDKIAGHILRRVGAILDLTWACIRLETGAEALGFDWNGRNVIDASTHQPILLDAHAKVTPLVINGKPVGQFVMGAKRHDLEHTPEDLELIETLAPLIAAALQNALLVRQLEGQVACLTERGAELMTLSARLIQIQEEERRHLALDLHDDALQRSILLARELRTAGESYEQNDLVRLTEMADDISESLRALCTGLRPSVLDDLGLIAGLEWLVTHARAQRDLEVHLEIDERPRDRCARLDPDLETALYRVVQEALNNCVKHADAHTVLVRLHREPGRLLLLVRDDGWGIDDSAAVLHSSGIGLLGMRERLKPWNGTIDLMPRQPHGLCLGIQIMGV